MTKEQEEWWEQIFHDTLRKHKFTDEETNILETDCSTPMSPFGIHNMVRRIVTEAEARGRLQGRREALEEAIQLWNQWKNMGGAFSKALRQKLEEAKNL